MDKIKKIIKYIKLLFNYYRIPKGDYCYKIKKITYSYDGMPIMHTRMCPYWDYIKEFPDQDSGYCHLIEKGDFDYKLNEENNFEFVSKEIIDKISKKYSRNTGSGILWDQCKECHLREYSLKYLIKQNENIKN